jgi:biopolymer transport protein ExbB
MLKKMWMAFAAVGVLWAGMAAYGQEGAAAGAAPAAGGAAAVAAPAGEAGGAMAVDKAKEAKPGRDKTSMSLINVITRSGWFGIMIWVMLIACSITMVALAVDSFISIREKKIADPVLVSKVRDAMQQGDVVKAIKHCEETPGPLANILNAGFSNVQEGFDVIQEAVGVSADLEGEMMLQRVTSLSVISNTTPMLGLIGTVQGMIYAFHTLGTQAAGAAQQSMLAVNISHGLWATAVGLGTAVPATIFFYYFKNRATRIILNMEALTLDLIKALRNVEVVTE